MDVAPAVERFCYLPSSPGGLLVGVLCLGVLGIAIFTSAAIWFDSEKKRATVHKLEFLEHLLLHAGFYGSAYSAWIGLAKCGFGQAEVIVSIVFSALLLRAAFRVGEVRAEREEKAHNEHLQALVDAFNA